jgi:transcriptional regulator with XRE-family HTH domain
MKKGLISLGLQIKELREKSGFTQKNIANFLGVDQSLISKFEAGERPVSADMLDKMAALFSCSISAFEEPMEDIKALHFALRSSEICEADLKTISVINKIALNSIFMTNLLNSEAL